MMDGGDIGERMWAGIRGTNEVKHEKREWL